LREGPRECDHRAALHIIFAAKKPIAIATTIEITGAEFLDDHAQGIILAVIFQSIDAKICNRA
jgi:hypothetical protein